MVVFYYIKITNNNKNLFFNTVSCENQQVQPTVVSGMHEQCGVAVIKLKNLDKNLDEVLDKISSVQKQVNKLAPKMKSDDIIPTVLAGIGFDTKFWKQICEKKKIGLPDGIGDYKPRTGLPYTHENGQVILHVKAKSRSLCFETIKAFVDLIPEQNLCHFTDHYGWQFKDGRDLSGFLDGTENVASDEEREQVAINKQGGSFLIHQRWEHNLKALEKFALKDQEDIFGRKKDSSIELNKKDMKTTAHVSRMRDENFQKIRVVRQSMPFGTVSGPNGLLFLAYSNQVSKFDKMLDRLSDPSATDGITKYSKNVAGNYFYFPSFNELNLLSSVKK